ncbi:MAG: hypothetical protein U5K51_13840 [Flavobacteriaceae bacterium]|nr:hypothetical protein [Flavobacteriaceae bacterium]
MAVLIKIIALLLAATGIQGNLILRQEKSQIRPQLGRYGNRDERR